MQADQKISSTIIQLLTESAISIYEDKNILTRTLEFLLTSSKESNDEYLKFQVQKDASELFCIIEDLNINHETNQLRELLEGVLKELESSTNSARPLKAQDLSQNLKIGKFEGSLLRISSLKTFQKHIFVFYEDFRLEIYEGDFTKRVFSQNLNLKEIHKKHSKHSNKNINCVELIPVSPEYMSILVNGIIFYFYSLDFLKCSFHFSGFHFNTKGNSVEESDEAQAKIVKGLKLISFTSNFREISILDVYSKKIVKVIDIPFMEEFKILDHYEILNGMKNIVFSSGDDELGCLKLKNEISIFKEHNGNHFFIFRKDFKN